MAADEVAIDQRELISGGWRNDQCCSGAPCHLSHRLPGVTEAAVRGRELTRRLIGGAAQPVEDDGPHGYISCRIGLQPASLDPRRAASSNRPRQHRAALVGRCRRPFRALAAIIAAAACHGERSKGDEQRSSGDPLQEHDLTGYVVGRARGPAELVGQAKLGGPGRQRPAPGAWRLRGFRLRPMSPSWRCPRCGRRLELPTPRR
jgi:hypothetical protein